MCAAPQDENPVEECPNECEWRVIPAGVSQVDPADVCKVHLDQAKTVIADMAADYVPRGDGVTLIVLELRDGRPCDPSGALPATAVPAAA